MLLLLCNENSTLDTNNENAFSLILQKKIFKHDTEQLSKVWLNNEHTQNAGIKAIKSQDNIT